MIKKILTATALIALTGCSTFAPSKCETQACQTASMISKSLNELAAQGVSFNDAVALGGAVADREVVNVTMYLAGTNAEKFRLAIANHPEMEKQMKRDMQIGVTQGNCAVPAFRQFLEIGGSINYEIRYKDTAEKYHSIAIERCTG